MSTSDRREQPQQAMRFEHFERNDAQITRSSLRLPAAPQLVMLHATQPPSWVSSEIESGADESCLPPSETSQDYDASLDVSEFPVPARVRRGSFAAHLRAALTGTAAVIAIWVGLIVFPNTARDDVWSRSLSATPSAGTVPPSAARASQGAQVARTVPSQLTPAAYVVSQHDAFVQPQGGRAPDKPLQRWAQPQMQSSAQQQQSVPQQRLVSGQQTVPPQQAVVAQPVQPHHEIILSSEEVDRLMSLGKKFLGQGDIETARAIFARAAEARDPRAALMLGTTYDPAGLKAMGVIGLPADLSKARSWYSRAVEFGSHEAGTRLALLSLQTR
jgi:hypothetical protein